MLKQNRSLLIVALIAMVDMLGYGIIIPIMYAYSKKFGLSDFQNGLLFAAFSVCQFLSTPIIGRLSDKYGRKPLLLISIAGTAASFFMLAFAHNAIFLFLARMLDGITAGNIPVVFGVISDTTKPEERPKAFGLVGAAFNFGFVFGPAVAAFTVGLGSYVPFLIAGSVSIVAVILTALFLPETNKHMGEIKEGKLFDLGLLWKTLFDPNVGSTFIITLIFFLAFACSLIYGFQPFTMNVLHVSESMNAVLFTVFGVIGLIAQAFLVARITKALGMKRAFQASILFTSVSFVMMALSFSLPLFIAAMVVLAIANSVAQTLIPTILSQEADAKSQGSIQGLNASYRSIGTIFGPILGGLVATFSIHSTFVVGALLILACFALSFRATKADGHRESAF